MWMMIWVTLMWLNTLVDIDVDIFLGDIDMDVDDTVLDINVYDNLGDTEVIIWAELMWIILW